MILFLDPLTNQVNSKKNWFKFWKNSSYKEKYKFFEFLNLLIKKEFKENDFI